jgi:hypothetical protein
MRYVHWTKGIFKLYDKKLYMDPTCPHMKMVLHPPCACLCCLYICGHMGTSRIPIRTPRLCVASENNHTGLPRILKKSSNPKLHYRSMCWWQIQKYVFLLIGYNTGRTVCWTRAKVESVMKFTDWTPTNWTSNNPTSNDWTSETEQGLNLNDPTWNDSIHPRMMVHRKGPKL